MSNQPIISSFPATVTISAAAAHGMSLPEYPDSQNGGSALVQTLYKGNTVTVSGWVAVQQTAVQLNWLDLSSVVPAGYQTWWVANGFYVPTSATEEQPDPTVGQLTPPNGSWNALIENAAAQGSAGAIIPNAVNSAGNALSGLGLDIKELAVLLVVAFVIYAILSTGALNLVHFKRQD